MLSPHVDRAGEAQRREARDQRLERERRLEPRELRAEAEVEAVAEREVADVASRDVEPVRIRELRGVAVRGGEQQHELLARAAGDRRGARGPRRPCAR